MDQLKQICAWCSALIRDGKLPISHGLCRTCGDKMLAEMEAA